MPQPVVIDQFEGPLGLLLELVEQNQMPVTDIAVATITSQYLKHVTGLDGLAPEELSEFLQLGTRLAYIKSLALLPTTQPDEQTDELRLLAKELTEYKRYQTAAKTLAVMATAPSWPRTISASLAPSDVPLPQVSVAQLAAAFQRVLKRLAPVSSVRSLSAQLSQADIVERLRSKLSSGPFELGVLLDGLHDRLEVVVTFSALLEIIRDGFGIVTQTSQFAPIMVDPV